MKLEAALENSAVRRTLITLLERQYGLTERIRSPMLRLDERRMPEFGPNRRAGEADEAWEALKTIEAEGLVRIDPVRARHGFALYELNPVVRLVPEQAPRACQLVGFVIDKDPWGKEWRHACLAADWLGAEAREQLAARPHRIGTRSPAEVLDRWRTLVAGNDSKMLYVREAAGAFFWGLSKCLDDRVDLVNLVRGSAGRQIFLESPILVNVHVIEGHVSTGVLFVENQASFECAKEGRIPAARSLDLVYSAGFKASAARVRDQRTASLYPSYTSNRDELERFSAWLFSRREDVPTYFWGDLDYAALWILKGLRLVFPGMRAWQPGYKPMVGRIQSGNGHRAEEDVHKGEQKVLGDATGCAYADQVLLPAIAQSDLFFDQEGFIPSE